MQEKNIVIITQNEVGVGLYPNGWYKRPDGKQVYLLQGFKKHNPHEYPEAGIVDLIKQIKAVSWELDAILVYLGDDALENAIKALGDFPSELIVYVLCPCHIETKKYLIARAERGNTRVIEPEGNDIAHYKMLGCGGQAPLNLIFETFILTGEIPYNEFS